MTEVDSEISAATVEKYLTQHPEFFQGRNDLLANLKVPHASGQAVSLVEKQLAILRERNTELRNRLSQLIESARGNDRLFAHSRKLVLALLDCKSVAQAVDLVYSSFARDFGIETTQIILFDHQAITNARSDTIVSADKYIGRYLKARQTVGGGLNADEIRYVFGEKASSSVGSAAMSVLSYGEVFGVLAIGNEDPEFYQTTMGTLFLNYIAEVLSRVLRDLTKS